jgi:homoserine O-succinyltransferase
VRYWRELEEILRYARGHVACTLGLCWGGLALGKVIGVEKRRLPKKLFGVFKDRVLVRSHDALEPGARSFVCAQSRHSGADEEDLARAAGDRVVRALARGDRTGTTMFETTDGRYLAHLGHPEYEGERLAFEWNRDRALGRTDVEPPVSFDADAPETTWRGHREAVVSGFVARASHGTATREGRARGLSEARAAAARGAP